MPNPKPAAIEELVKELRKIGKTYLKKNSRDASLKDASIAGALGKISSANSGSSINDKLALLDTLSDLFVSDVYKDEPEPADEKLVNAVRVALTEYQPFINVGLDLDSYASLGFLMEALKGEILAIQERNSYTYKEMFSVQEAFEQVLTQEFFRLIIPEQPRVGATIRNDNLFVKTKKITNEQRLSSDELIEMANVGKITGLAKIQVLDVLLREKDFNLRQLRVTENNVIVKVDSNSNLPQPGEDVKEFFEDGVVENLYSDDSFIDENDLFNIDVLVRIGEVDETILSLAILSPDLIHKFICNYSDNAKFNDQMTSSFKLLLGSFCNAAIKNFNFQQFLLTATAPQTFSKIVKSWENWPLKDGSPWLTAGLKKQLSANFNLLQATAERFSEPSSTTRSTLPAIKQATPNKKQSLASSKPFFKLPEIQRNTTPSSHFRPPINPKKK